MKLLGKFDPSIIEPILSETAFKLPHPVQILSLTVDPKGGELLIDVPSRHVEQTTRVLKQQGISVVEIGGVSIDEKSCTDCGVCISVCKYDAIHFDKSMDVHLDAEKCVRCGFCFDVCPVFAIKTNRWGMR